MAKDTLIFIISAYKKLVSPFLQKTCRFNPSCSQYSIEAIGKYGAFKGTYLAVLRLLRCSGYFRGGFDPVK